MITKQNYIWFTSVRTDSMTRCTHGTVKPNISSPVLYVENTLTRSADLRDFSSGSSIFNQTPGTEQSLDKFKRDIIR